MTMGGVAPDRRGFLLFLVLLAALACACLGRSLAGELFVSTETVYRHVQPWSGLEPSPPPDQPIHNGDLADHPTVWLPMQWATRGMVREWAAGGEPPLWQPQSYCGSPWLGNMSSALFSPFTWLFVVLPFAPAFALCAAAKWLLAGTGAWLLARRLGVSPAGRALAGMAFAFCGFQVVWINSCLTNVSVFAPWLLLAIERVVERASGGRVAALALVSWQVLVGGHPETSLYVGLGAAVYATCRWLAAPADGTGAEGRGRKAVALVAGASLGAALSVVQWWPFLEYALHSLGREQRLLQPDLFRPADAMGKLLAIAALAMLFVLVRVGLRKPVGEAAEGGGVPASPQRMRMRWVGAAALVVIAALAARSGGLRPALLMEIVPDWFGRSLDGGVYRGPLFYNDTAAGFCGGALFVLALATGISRAGDRRVLALALTLLVVAARWFRVPLVAELVELLPQVPTTGATRALAMVALMVALLGGFALDELRERPRRLALAAGGCLLFFGAFALAGEPFPDQDARRAADAGMASSGVGLDELPDLADAGPTGHGAQLRGRAPAAAERIRIFVNGVEKATVPTLPPLADGRRPFEWRFTGSHRLESGGYEITLDALDAQGHATRFAQAMARCERPPVSSWRWGVHLAAVGALLLAALFVGSARLRVGLLLLATAIELCFFGADYNDTTPASRVPAKVEPLARLEQERRELGPFRVFAARNHVHPNLHLLFDLDVLRGYDALEPVNYIHSLDFLYRDGVVVPWTEMDVGTLDFAGYPGAQLADLMNVRYLLSEEPAPPGYRETWRRGTLALHENPDPLARAFTVQRGTHAVRAFESRSDLRTLAAWETDDELTFPGAARVLSLDHRRGRISTTVESDSGTILIVSENFDGWQATLDGVPVEPRRTHGTFLSLVVPTGGRHAIELVYRPRSVVWGLIVSAGALLPLFGLLLFARRRSSDAERVIRSDP